MKPLVLIIILFILAIISYALWSSSGRGSLPQHPTSGNLHFTEHGIADSSGNLVAVQPYMQPTDYQSQTAFQAKLDYYFEALRSRGWLSAKTIVVLPEYLGTWLVVLNEKQAVYQVSTIQQALTTMVTSNLAAFAGAWFHAQAPDKVKDAVFRMKARQMAAAYELTFSTLAYKYGITVVAGSIILPEPSIVKGHLTVGPGKLVNVACLFHPDGSLDSQITVKAYPTADENQFIVGGSSAALPVYGTPAGTLGIAVCADSWYPDVYDHFANQTVRLLTVPSFLVPSGIMDKPWQGYSGNTEPADVDQQDIQNLTEGQAWEKYALLGRFRQHGFLAGINVFLRGTLWDLGSDGRTYSFLADSVFVGERKNQAHITCLWLP
jgi:predicted amidohydrolase